MRGLVLAAVALAALSLLGPSQPSYDPWAWLLWGREVAALDLSTSEGPAWKPGPVLVTTALAPLGQDVAPALWLLVARAGAVLAVLLAARVAWRVAPSRGRAVAAAAAGAGVALCAGAVWHGAVGHIELLAVALALAAVDRALDDRWRAALLLGVAVGLLRVEAWPFLAALGVWRWRQAPAERALLAGCAAAVPALWFGPELWGSGEPLRSGSRALVPNPGQPATADVPLLASLRAAAGLPFWPLAVLALAAPRGVARRLAGAGVAWVLLVAAMAQAGFSGEPRYALPGVAVLAVAAGAGAGRLVAAARDTSPAPAVRRPSRAVLAAAGIAALVALPGRLELHGRDLAKVADEAELYGTLDDAVAAAGGPGAVLACGRPATGRYRGPAVAYVLGVHKARVLTPALPGGGGVALRSRLRRSSPVEPAAAGRTLARSARWDVRATGC